MIKIEEIKEICKRYNMNQEQVKEQIKTYEILNKMGGVYISCNAWGYYYTIDKRNYTSDLKIALVNCYPKYKSWLKESRNSLLNTEDIDYINSINGRCN